MEEYEKEDWGKLDRRLKQAAQDNGDKPLSAAWFHRMRDISDRLGARNLPRLTVDSNHLTKSQPPIVVKYLMPETHDANGPRLARDELRSILINLSKNRQGGLSLQLTRCHHG